MSSATVSMECSKCSNPIEIAKRWTPGGVNDYGGYFLQCTKCSHIFAFHLGRDINDSRMTMGAKVLDQYDDEMDDKKDVLEKYGLSEG